MFQMFSRKSDIILKHLCSFLFEKMPASNQEPGIFYRLEVNFFCSRVIIHMRGPKVVEMLILPQIFGT